VGGEGEDDTKESGNRKVGGYVCRVRGVYEGAESIKGALVHPSRTISMGEGRYSEHPPL
jgi:hypothetical protein